MFFAEVAEHQINFSFLTDVLANNNSPVYKPHALQFTIREEYFGLSDVDF